tara:strand:- start:211 stop:546 length:336 start_codon:yes stop_codon:yes gene_type:complete
VCEPFAEDAPSQVGGAQLVLAPKAVAQLVVLPAAEGLAASLLSQTRRKRLRAARLEVGAPQLGRVRHAQLPRSRRTHQLIGASPEAGAPLVEGAQLGACRRHGLLHGKQRR